MKVQINSLDALERLLGGDTTVEIELRGAIVQEFAKKHLKAVAKSEEVTNAIKGTQSEILRRADKFLNESVGSFERNYLGNINNLKLHPTIEEKIKSKVHDVVEARVSAVVLEAIESKLTSEEIQKLVDRRMEYYTNDMVKTAVQKRLEALKAQL